MDKKIIGGLAIGAIVIGGIFGINRLMADTPAAVSKPIPGKASSAAKKTSGVLDMICELRLDLEGQMTLGINSSESSRVAMAQVDFDKSSGWYQGTLAMHEGRAGNLSVEGQKLRVSRPAMFQRFGTTITGEQFVIDRSTGDFEQSITLKDGRKVTLIRGACAKVDKPPF